MTEAHGSRPRRRRHAALGGRILAAGLSVSGAIVLITAMGEAGTPTAGQPPAPVAPPAAAGQRDGAATTGPAVTAAPSRARANARSRAS